MFNYSKKSLVFLLTILLILVTTPNIVNATETDEVVTNDVAHIVLTKNATPASGSSVSRGDTITYNLNYDLTNTYGTSNLSISDNIPANTTLVAGSITNGGTESNGKITWNLVNPDDTGTVSFSVKVNSNVVGGTVINNAAAASGDFYDIGDLSTTSNQTTHTVVYKSVMSIEKSSNPVTGSTVSRGSDIVYTIKYNETSGTDAASDVVIKDTVPAGTTLVAGSITNSGTESNGKITWNIGNVAASASGSVSFTVKVNSDVANATIITNGATISYCCDENINSNEVKHTVNVETTTAVEQVVQPIAETTPQVVTKEVKVEKTSAKAETKKASETFPATGLPETSNLWLLSLGLLSFFGAKLNH